ncbi:MAG: sulfotransferase [Actinomycetota bacterium]
MGLTSSFAFIVGAHKAGTTAVAAWLDQRPGVSVALSKEPNVFSVRDVTRTGDSYWDEFEQEPLLIDASTTYSICSVHPGTAGRIHRFDPSARIIYLTRDPLSRLWSGWRQHLDESGYAIAADFRTALRTDPSLIDATRYRSQLEQYREFFPDEQILTVPLERLTADAGERRRLLRFLDLKPVDLELERQNGGEDKGQDHPLVRAALDTTVGMAVGDRLRRSPVRRHLASVRRRFLLKPLDPAQEAARSWASVDAAEMVRADCRAYLDDLGLEHGLWPSLAPEVETADRGPGRPDAAALVDAMHPPDDVGGRHRPAGST